MKMVKNMQEEQGTTMARYAKDFTELEFAQLVMWKDRINAVWNAGEEKTAGLVPYDVLVAYNGDEDSLDQKTITVPIRQIQIPDPVKAEQDTLRAFFRLDVMPWDLLGEGKYPFSSATSKLEITEDDLLFVIDRLPMFRNRFLLDAWEDSFPALRIIIPEDETPGFTMPFLARCFFSMMEWFDPEEDDWQYIWELRDGYLQSRGKPLSETVLPKMFKGDMAAELEEYCKKNPVTEEIHDYYVHLLDELMETGNRNDINTYAYAYYGGNSIVPCDWKKSEQALLKLFDPDDDPPEGDEWAANSLGYIYGSNRLGKLDYEKAFVCFLYAANHGVIEATYKLSDLYRLGLGVRKDPEMAWAILNKLYQKTDKKHISRGKYADIMLRMGYCYRDGVGVAPDRETALKFFLDAKRGIEARLKKNPGYGDEVVARNIQAAIDSVK